MIRTIIILTVLCAVINAPAQQAGGTVFADNNKNGLHDKGEKGIKDVVVTNGIEFTVTDSRGQYNLPAPDNCIIFIIKPSGYKVLVNNNNLPQFYYLHFPNGMPMLKNGNITPTGPLPKEINFALTPENEPDRFKMLVFGDPQVRSMEDVEFLGRDIVAELAGKQEYRFVTVVGDLVHDRFDLYGPLNKVLSSMEVPVYTLPGNHDINFDALTDNLANSAFQAVYGPKTYAFNYANVHFIMLDNIIYSGDTIRKRYNDGFDDAVLSFVEKDLQYVPKDKLVVLMMHAPFIRNYSKEPILNLDRLLTLLSPFPHTFSVSGHDHTVSQQIISSQFGWAGTEPHQHFNTGTVCGDWWQGSFDETGIPDATMYDGTPNGYSILNISGNTYTVDYKAARKPASYQMSIFTSNIVSSISTDETNRDVIVNFFTGWEKNDILIRFDGGDWQKMIYTLMPDPYIAMQRKIWENPQYKLNGRMPSRAMPGRHIWKSTIPGDLKPGIHTIEVKAVDYFGREYEGYSFVRTE